LSINPDIQEHLVQMLKTWITPHEFPGIDMQWSGILGIGKVKFPIIKKISENVIVAVRMGGMGVALGTLAGHEAAELMLGISTARTTDVVS
ncbi:MAG TPA: FAD-dependent oxidoreductase, partial [Saprospiraceae bacterium]|nr:FAD-dependent oxidoreductase [Saprospiraceae bacterium]